MKTKKFNKQSFRQLGMVFVLFALFAFFSILKPTFFRWNNIVTIIRQTSIVCTAGAGVLLIMICGCIDLSLGYMLSCVCMFTGIFLVNFQLPIIPACLLVILIFMALGSLVGTIIAKLKLAPFIVTLSFMNVYKGLAFLVTNGRNIYNLPDTFNVIGSGYWPIVITVIALLISWFILCKTYFGRYICAVGSNEEAAKFSGINVARVKIAVYALEGFFASIAGFIMTARIRNASPGTGNGYEFEVITACILGGIRVNGGKGSVMNVIVGSLVISVLSSGMIALQISEYIQMILKGSVLLIAVIYDVMQKRNGCVPVQ